MVQTLSSMNHTAYDIKALPTMSVLRISSSVGLYAQVLLDQALAALLFASIRASLHTFLGA